MKWLKRTGLSIVRRPTKSLLLLLVVFVLGNLLAGSLAIVTTSKNVKEQMKASIAPEARLLYQSYSKTSFDELNDYMQMMNEISSDERVIENEYHFTHPGRAIYSDLKIASNDNFLSFQLVGTNVRENKRFKDGEYQITGESRYFTDEELQGEEPVILISNEFTQVRFVNGWDYVDVTTGLTTKDNVVKLSYPVIVSYDENNEPIYYNHKFDAKIIGSYSVKNYEVDNNLAYIPYQALAKIAKEAHEEAIKINPKMDQQYPKPDSAIISLKDLDSLMNFEAEVLSHLDSKKYVVQSTAETYKRNIGPVENLDMIAKIILGVSVFATIVILGLVVVFIVSDRKKEMGLYMSLGEKKKNIVAQALTEVLLVSLLALTLASVSGILVGNKISHYMLDVQRYIKREQNLGVIADLPVIYKPTEHKLSFASREAVIDTFETQPSAEYFIILYLVGGSSVVVSCILPMRYLTQLKPKEIML